MSKQAKWIAWVAVAALMLIVVLAHCNEANAMSMDWEAPASPVTLRSTLNAQGVLAQETAGTQINTQTINAGLDLISTADYGIADGRVSGVFQIALAPRSPQSVSLMFSDTLAELELEFSGYAERFEFDEELRPADVPDYYADQFGGVGVALLPQMDAWLNDLFSARLVKGDEEINALTGAIQFSFAPVLRCFGEKFCKISGTGAKLFGGGTLNPLQPPGLPLDDRIFPATIRISGVPEPSAAVLLGLALGGLAFVRHHPGAG